MAAAIATESPGIRRSALSRWYRRYEAWLLGIAGILTLAILWQIAGTVIEDNIFISSPVAVMRAMGNQIASGQLVSDTIISLGELIPGFALAVAIGIPVGLAMGRYRLVEYSLDPYVWFFYSAPIVAFYPLMIMWLGLGTKTIIALTFLFAIFPIIANTIMGVQEVDRSLIRAARSFGASELQIFILVILPASVPAIAAGLRLGFGRALIGTVVGEFFGTNAGLGFRIALYGTEMRVGEMFAPVVVVMVIGVGILQLLRWLESFVESWRP